MFLFSTHHPARWSAQKVVEGDEKTYLLGYQKNKKLHTYTVYGDYLNTRAISEVWFGGLEVTFFHYPFSRMFEMIKESNFEIGSITEPKATQKAKGIFPEFYGAHQKIPLFIIFELAKR